MNWYNQHKFSQLPANWTEELKEHVISAITTRYAPATDMSMTRPGQIFWSSNSQRIGKDYASINIFFNGAEYIVNIRDTADLAHMWEASGATLRTDESLVGSNPITGVIRNLTEEGESIRYFAANNPYDFTEEMEQRIVSINNGDEDRDDDDNEGESGWDDGYGGGGDDDNPEFDPGPVDEDESMVPIYIRKRFKDE